ncbi:Rv3654c family TadE-like protein [Arthrobacter sp. Ld5]|uniref:Rv3654c family TadE-like protein n=1 Tax=Arthrobacter sp. Ld5 TaxID=649152 RepID=UPI003EC0F3F8
MDEPPEEEQATSRGNAAPSRPADAERGAGTILMGALSLLALLLVASAVLLLQAASAASKAATAADLAALAAADTARGLSSGEPCAAASAVAGQHGAVVEACEIGATGVGTAVVRVSVGVPGLLPDAGGRARAGPPP